MKPWLLAITVVSYLLAVLAFWWQYPEPSVWIVPAALIIPALAAPAYALVLRLIDRLRPGPKDPSADVIENLNLRDVEYAIDRLSADMLKNEVHPDIIVGVDRGGAIVSGMLGKALGLPVVHISSAKTWTISSSLGSLDEGLRDADKRNPESSFGSILLVDDASRSGRRLERARLTLKRIADLEQSELNTAVILYVERTGSAAQIRDPNFLVYRTKNSVLALPWDRAKPE